MMGDAVEDGRTKFFIISQRNSWTRLKISSEMFKMLCHFYRVFPKYLESVFQFNPETCKTEEYYSGGYYRHVHDHESTSLAIFEISYNVRHFEKHGRELQDPWSCRQCSVYQNYSHRNNVSTWFLIQIPNGTRRHLERLNSEVGGSSPCDHPMGIHLYLLRSCEKNWGPYVGYLGDELSLMNQKISFPKEYGEFNLDVSHSQTLARLRRKLEDAHSLLESNVDVASILSEHAKEMQKRGLVLAETNERFQSEVRQYKLRLRYHVRSVQKHLGFSEDIRVLIFKIMDFRNDELLRANSISLKELAHETARENKAMLTIACKSKADSRTMKIATLIATIYLPISLVTSFFSTGLIQFNSENGRATNITVRKEIWVFIVIVVSIMACTLASAYFWARRRKKSAADQTSEVPSEEFKV
ncbi:hypothetical protein K440DRAFT_662644 [Wilcoxina mikolae CBS 423.85]|nr:hypothetical protein K440DRAFT_662644 [Wilcoxina mikolae CBS 423.85]